MEFLYKKEVGIQKMFMLPSATSPFWGKLEIMRKKREMVMT
jgi:hypothetical protein